MELDECVREWLCLVEKRKYQKKGERIIFTLFL